MYHNLFKVWQNALLNYVSYHWTWEGGGGLKLSKLYHVLVIMTYLCTMCMAGIQMVCYMCGLLGHLKNLEWLVCMYMAFKNFTGKLLRLLIMVIFSFPQPL